MGDSPLSVLLVEDDPFDAELISIRLQTSRPGSTMQVVDAEADFVDALRADGFDLILSDFALPLFSGLEALAIARRMAPEVPFIFVSGVLDEEHVVDVLKQGATDYVVKVRMERLPLVVDRAIAEAAERRARQQTERALRESETMYSRLVEALQDHAIVSLTPQGTIRSWNGAARRLFGYSFEEVRGRSARLLFPADDARSFDDLLSHAGRSGHFATEDGRLVRRDGTRFWSTTTLTAVLDPDGSLSSYALVARDVSERIGAAEAVEAARREAERANRAKDRFLAVLSHELRTPLTPLLTIAHVLEARIDALPADARHVVPMLRRNVLMEARLIDDLLDLTAIERNKMVLRRKPADLHVILRNALDLSMEEVSRKRLQLNVRLGAREARTSADDARILQVFSNLIRNAVKFTSTGGRIDIETRNPRPGRFEARVIDDGIGISPQRLPYIFRLFEQGTAATARAYGGLGIGLAIARELVHRHGGTLEARSEGEGCGSTFVMEVPLERRESARETAPGREPGADEPSRRDAGATDRRRVLLVEDHADVAASVRAMLEAAGHVVRAASSVAAARTALRDDTFDVLVCDLGLPDGSGHDVLALAAPGLPAVAISGFGMEADIRASRSAGFAAHLVKPFEALQLLDAIAKAAPRERAQGLDSAPP